MAQGVDVADRLPTTGEHGGHIDQDLAAVMPRHETTPGQRAGELRCQAHLVGQQPHRRTAGVRDHADTITRDGQARRPRCTLHLPSAFPYRSLCLRNHKYSVTGQALWYIQGACHPLTHEGPRLKQLDIDLILRMVHDAIRYVHVDQFARHRGEAR